MSLQKQKTPGEDDKTPSSVIKDDKDLGAAAEKGKGILAKLAEATKKKKGHWESCCGVRHWVED